MEKHTDRLCTTVRVLETIAELGTDLVSYKALKRFLVAYLRIISGHPHLVS